MSHYILNKSDTIREIDIELNQDQPKIGVFLSGGLDSAVLLYALLLEREKTKKKIEFTALTVSKVSADVFAGRIVQVLREKFGQINHATHIDNEGAAAGTITPAIQRQLRGQQFDLVYTGINSNPPTEKFYSKWGVFPKRPDVSPHDTLILPFLKLYKSHIIELAVILKIEHIVAMTHSCTEQTDSRCSICFACDERAWGFKENHILDPGSL